MHTSLVEKIILAVVIIVSIALFIEPVIQRLRIIQKGRGSLPCDRFGERIARWIREVLLQGTVIVGRPLPGWAHALVFWSFLFFLLETLDIIFRMFGLESGILGTGPFHQFYRGILALVSIPAFFGIVYLLIRRFVSRPPSLGKISWTSGLVAIFIMILIATFIATSFFMSEDNPLFKPIIWIHLLTIFAFLILIPRSKHIHLFLSLYTTFCKDFELAAIKPLIIDMESDDVDEENMYLGAEKFTDLGKYTILGSLTCVECGRCYDNCPARITGKKLNPKELMLNLRETFIANPDKEIIGDKTFSDMIWQCTTCGACTFQCPVGIDQPIAIIEMRRGYVANSIFPDTLRPLFDNLESTANPWNYQPTDAAKFIAENKFPEYESGKILWWMGCMARYNDRYRKVALAFKKLLDTAGVNYGVLVEEQCTGDAARRAGNEFLFQMLAKANIEMLNEANPSMIVTTCPHCLRTLKEYKDLGLKKEIEIVNHSHFLMGLINEGKLKIKATAGNSAAGTDGGKGTDSAKSVVYHDGCYLSRYVGDEGYRNPRLLLAKTGATIHEPERAKRKSFCCGAGGGMLFTEETEGTRINHERVEELMKVGADEVCISCPFCQMMLTDGFTDKGIENAKVMDIAEVLAEGL
ncbi:MAG: heterodisulfide reductase-related iron-sulfur binding cluster [bacterium]|nr:heterodisulfide reductase-related iron-sulfur binding cluster [bacterium]